jgi:hypothetical protein
MPAGAVAGQIAIAGEMVAVNAKTARIKRSLCLAGGKIAFQLACLRLTFRVVGTKFDV